MNYDGPAVSQRDIWIGDLLFLRLNRSLKYTQNGVPLILAELPQWSELGPRLLRSLALLLLQLLAIFLNFAVLLLSLNKTRQQAYHKKVQFLMASLAICNLLLALGLFSLTFLLDIYYDVDTFDTLVLLNSPPQSASSLWQFAKFLFHSELVDNLFTVQQLVLLLTALDRYLTLFDQYSPHAKHTRTLGAICSLPFLLGILLFDRRILSLLIASPAKVNIIRLLALLCPLLLSLVFSVCAMVGLLQQGQMLRRIFGTLFRDEFSFSFALLLILSLDLPAKFGIFLELLQRNLRVQITLSKADSNLRFQAGLSRFYAVSHVLMLLSPLLFPFLSLLFINFYRRRLLSSCANFIRRLANCRQRHSLDYSSETMRSIIAEQSKTRQMGNGRKTAGGGQGRKITAEGKRVGMDVRRPITVDWA